MCLCKRQALWYGNELHKTKPFGISVMRFAVYNLMASSASLFNLEISFRSAAHVVGRRLAGAIKSDKSKPVDLFLCVVDHFEPNVGQPPQSVARARMEDWMERYPQIAARHKDADGRFPAHSFFYPYDEYDEWEFCRLVELCQAGWGEIDVHLHHRDDTSDSLRQKLRDAVRLYHRHAVLPIWPNDGRPAWGFIHGNWALDNSRCEHGRNFCGVNDELTLLAQEGCYADFTFPAWEHTAQPRQLNSVYYAFDDPNRPKSYDKGEAVRSGGKETGTLLLIQGPLTPYIKRTAQGPRPAMDDGDLASYRRYAPERLDRWVRAGICVSGRPDRVFVKLHCHGAADANRESLLGHDFEALFADAEARYNDGERFRLHYVTARELFNVVKATEANAPVDINTARDWVLPPPPSASLQKLPSTAAIPVTNTNTENFVAA